MSAKQPILIFFGGQSAEHEVSIITGLQVVENIDRSGFDPHVIYVRKDGVMDYKPNVTKRGEFSFEFDTEVQLGRDAKGGYLRIPGTLREKRVYPTAAYLAFHGGTGEGGAYQGLLESLGIPYSSPSYESSVVALNKLLTKAVFEKQHIPCLTGSGVIKQEFLGNPEKRTQELVSTHSLPMIVKPAHLGSSIGIKVAKTEIELEKALRESFFMDSVVLVEPFVKKFVEYNISVRSDGDEIELSAIEKPVSKDEILSFADKYERGGKKSGGDGMASLDREVPAKIDEKLANKIREIAQKAYRAIGASGLVRIDFMVDESRPDEPFITEINTIPGSVSYYLWEAVGESFTEQITHALTDAVRQFESRHTLDLEYESDIVEKFVAG
jgi:D-alanine-D-alanine ligase